MMQSAISFNTVVFDFLSYLYFPPYYMQAKVSKKSGSYRGWNKPYYTAGGAYNGQLYFI